MSVSEEQILKDLVTKRCPLTGALVVDKAKLAAVVKAEGLSFVDATAFDFDFGSLADCGCDCSKPVVFLLNGSQLGYASTDPRVVGLLGRAEVSGGVLRNHKGVTIGWHTSQLQIAKWIRDDDGHECIVCYKTTCDKSLESKGMGCVCGTLVCFGCTIDLLVIAPKEMTTECPNCRCEIDAQRNLQLLIHAMFATVPCLEQIVGFSEEQLDFIEKMTGVDFRLSHERATEQVKLLDDAYDKIARKVIKIKKCREYSILFTCESRMRVYTAMREYIERKRKKKLVSASADDSRSSRLVARRGCANCGKQFWDKSEWKRALKCTKCQKAAYCSSKCRKKHAKAHTTECSSAKGAKQKRKPKKKKHKKKKRGCAPY